MLYYRTKKEANNKPMYRGKGRKANEEAWSIYIADELFTEKEVIRRLKDRRVYKPHLSVDSSTRPTTVLVRFKVPTPKKSGKKRSNPGEQAA